jgi:hypothetical protein
MISKLIASTVANARNKFEHAYKITLYYTLQVEEDICRIWIYTSPALAFIRNKLN